MHRFLVDALDFERHANPRSDARNLAREYTFR
jgi:hypothetical protein